MFWKHHKATSSALLILNFLFPQTISKIHFESNTTATAAAELVIKVFQTISKIHFESNSQRVKSSDSRLQRCFRLSQRYILKAIHNCYCLSVFWKEVFQTISKIHFESNSQQECLTKHLKTRCFRLSQRYILKAIHNGTWLCNWNYVVFQTISKIHFESNSQRELLWWSHRGWCFRLSQRYILKAIHNIE